MGDDRFINRVIVGIIICLTSILGILLCVIYSDIRNTKSTRNKEVPVKTIKIWTIHGGIEDILNEVARTYESKRTDIKIEVTTFKNEVYQSSIENAVITNELPDVFFFWGYEKLKKFVDLDLVWDISEAMEKYYDGEKPLQGAMDGVTYNGQIYGMPVYGWCTALFCNRELFEKAQLQYPNTYEELLTTIEQLKAKGITPMSSGSKEIWLTSLYYMNLVLTEGTIEGVYEAATNPQLFKTEQFYHAAQKLEALIQAKPWGKNYLENDSYDASYDFSQGKAAMILSGSWVAANVEGADSKVKGKIDIISFPEIPQAVGVGGYADTLVINKQSQITQDESLQEAYFEIVKEVSTKAIEKYGIGLPAYENQKVNPKVFPTLYQCAQIAKDKTMHPAYDQVFDENFSSIYYETLSQLVSGQIDSDQFIENVAR
ncbi:MAG: extracellular solute-binding protein [Candidatus Cellulosilyticum pullistercoris]|uniref:Extracellular solute-binding protein n=1 Tax=Candidatus Cellulosilyticum pullistercoris TaxID=2838521 RepID=A0A9E2KBI4_9FIRM|nr:extracellular solute-binding protein [Candidatus Cellulosilyticum pullistercoris]